MLRVDSVRSINRVTEEIEFAVDGLLYTVFAPSAISYFETPGCTCRPIFIPHPSPRILIGGEDDCPVHGFRE